MQTARPAAAQFAFAGELYVERLPTMERPDLVEIDLANARTASELQALLRDSLDFPGWYGCNWNAFWDAITGLVDMPRTLRLIGWTEFNIRLPSDAQLMMECLQEMADKYPELASKVVYA